MRASDDIAIVTRAGAVIACFIDDGQMSKAEHVLWKLICMLEAHNGLCRYTATAYTPRTRHRIKEKELIHHGYDGTCKEVKQRLRAEAVLQRAELRDRLSLKWA